jgi:hypothetical protein
MHRQEPFPRTPRGRVTSPAASTADPVFEELCTLLQQPPRQRTISDYIRIGKLIDDLCPADGGQEDFRRQVYGARWAESLVERLAEARITLSPTMVYRYRRLATFPDRAFLRACRKAERARWEDVMRLLPVPDSELRLELLAVTGGREGDELSARAFKELVRLACLRGALPGRPGAARPRPAPVSRARRLRAIAQAAAAEATRWVDGEAALAAGLGDISDIDLAKVGEARAAIRLFRAAARRLDRALRPITAPAPARTTGSKSSRPGRPS